MEKIIKYPRTKHLEGSRLQKGDEDLKKIPFNMIKGKYIVIEEKIDGANTAISFSNKEMLLQSRGHYLTGGYRERHYNLFKKWAREHQEELYNILGERYIMYGEWMYAKHAIYYDNLPHYFFEFDIFDKEKEVFLDTPTRHKMLASSSVVSVPVLSSGVFNKIEDVLSFLKDSNYISSDHIANLCAESMQLGLNTDEVLKQTDNQRLMEGLYIKVEEDGIVQNRMKYVRPSFSQSILDSQTHWIDRPIIPNKITKKVDEL